MVRTRLCCDGTAGSSASVFVVFVGPLSLTCISSHIFCVLSCPWLVAWSPGLELVTTTSSHPIEETLPSTLKEDKESSEPEAEVKAYRDLSLLFARGSERSCTDVGTAMTPDDIMDVVATEFVFVENDVLDDELMTDEHNNQRYKNNSISQNTEEGGGGGQTAGEGSVAGCDKKDDDFQKTIEKCVAHPLDGSAAKNIESGCIEIHNCVCSWSQ